MVAEGQSGKMVSVGDIQIIYPLVLRLLLSPELQGGTFSIVQPPPQVFVQDLPATEGPFTHSSGTGLQFHFLQKLSASPLAFAPQETEDA